MRGREGNNVTKKKEWQLSPYDKLRRCYPEEQSSES